MSTAQQVRSQLPFLKTFGPNPVAVFVGGTSGIGENTARSFVQNSIKPHIYLVGRNEEQGNKLKLEFQTLNPDSQTRFIKGDVSLLRNVDKICEEIKTSEDKINLLFLSAGILTMSGRNETEEGLDKKLSLHFYSRLRFTNNLLPLLNKAAETPTENGKPLARVIAVLAGGMEKPIDTIDLSLLRTFSLSNCANHAITMTSLSFNRLARANSNVSFIHTQPGVVETNITREMNPLMMVGINSLLFLAKPWIMSAAESGERHCWNAIRDDFKGHNESYLVGPKGAVSPQPKVLSDAQGNGLEGTVWKHTEKVYKDICELQGTYDGN